jgi:glycosyltransferase involved in cell wall biosynthesis
VVFVLPDLNGGGAQRVMLNLARTLDPSRFSPRIIVLGRGDQLSSELPEGIPVERLNARRLRDGLPALIRALRRLKPELAISALGYVNLALLAIRPLLARTQIVVREANTVSATLSAIPRGVPGRFLYARLYPRATVIIAQSDKIAAEIRALAPRAKVDILLNPVDVNRLRARVRATSLARSGTGLRLVAAGRLTRQKGFDLLIPLIARLPGDAFLTIYGDGPDRAALEAQIVAHGLSSQVSLPGFSADLPGAIAGADFFVLPSRWEGLPNVALESLALGTPVVASDQAGLEGLARETAPGALTIVPVGEAFVEALAGQQAQPSSSTRPNLLPERYCAEAVAVRFADLLSRCLATPA